MCSVRSACNCQVCSLAVALVSLCLLGCLAAFTTYAAHPTAKGAVTGQISVHSSKHMPTQQQLHANIAVSSCPHSMKLSWPQCSQQHLNGEEPGMAEISNALTNACKSPRSTNLAPSMMTSPVCESAGNPASMREISDASAHKAVL